MTDDRARWERVYRDVAVLDLAEARSRRRGRGASTAQPPCSGARATRCTRRSTTGSQVKASERETHATLSSSSAA